MYTLVCSLGVAFGLAQGLIFRHYAVFGAASAALVIAPLACSVQKLRTRNGKAFWLNLLPLTVLHLVYGIARARALLDAGWHSRRTLRA
jgi:hypothetical protein